MLSSKIQAFYKKKQGDLFFMKLSGDTLKMFIILQMQKRCFVKFCVFHITYSELVYDGRSILPDDFILVSYKTTNNKMN